MIKITIEQCQDFLAKSDLPWTQYALGVGSKQSMVEHPNVQALISSVSTWPDPPITRHNDAAHPLHQMHLLLDLGLDANDAYIQSLAKKILLFQNSEGPFQGKISIPTHFGGNGQPELAWMLCDFPLLLSFLIRAGHQNHIAVQSAVEFLMKRAENNGWRCAGSMPKFRGPGRKDDFCPYATLIGLQVFSDLPDFHNSPAVLTAIDSINWHWEHSAERKIYMFAMGTHFRKLKYPLAWYDLIHVLDVFSHFEYAKETYSFQNMLAYLLPEQQPDGGFIPGSIYTAYKDWDFGQKRISSPTLTLAIMRILRRIV